MQLDASRRFVFLKEITRLASASRCSQKVNKSANVALVLLFYNGLAAQFGSLWALIPASPWPCCSESESKLATYLTLHSLWLEQVSRWHGVLSSRGRCGSLALLQHPDPFLNIVLCVLKSVLLRPRPAGASSSFRQIATFTALGVLLVELTVATIQNVHLRVEQLLVSLQVVPLQVQVPVKLTKLLPEPWSSFLAEFTVEDENGPFDHQAPYLVDILEELLLELSGIVNVLGTLNVASLVFIVPPTVNDDVGVVLLPHEEGEGRWADRVHLRSEGIGHVELLKELSFIRLLEE